MHKDSPREFKEYSLTRNGIKTVAKFTKSIDEVFKKHGDVPVEFYIYQEIVQLGNCKIRLEEYCTKSREEIEQILSKLKELKYDVTGHNIIKELFYSRRVDSLSVVTKAFVEIVNRSMDREKFGTKKMFCKELSLQDALQKKFEEIYRVETNWWDITKRKLNYDNPTANAREFFAEYSLSDSSGAIERSYYEVEKAVQILVDAGLVARWNQDIVKGRSWRVWTGMTYKGWKLVENAIGYRPEKHITSMENIEKINRALMGIDRKKYMSEFDREYSKNVKGCHKFVLE